MLGHRGRLGNLSYFVALGTTVKAGGGDAGPMCIVRPPTSLADCLPLQKYDKELRSQTRVLRRGLERLSERGLIHLLHLAHGRLHVVVPHQAKANDPRLLNKMVHVVQFGSDLPAQAALSVGVLHQPI